MAPFQSHQMVERILCSSEQRPQANCDNPQVSLYLAIFGFLCAVFCNAVTLHEDALRVATVRLAVLVDLWGADESGTGLPSFVFLPHTELPFAGNGFGNHLNGIVNQVVEDGEFTDSEWLSQILWHLLSRERLEPGKQESAESDLQVNEINEVELQTDAHRKTFPSSPAKAGTNSLSVGIVCVVIRD
eukprot:183439-Rhodomonas_salina.2